MICRKCAEILARRLPPGQERILLGGPALPAYRDVLVVTFRKMG